VSDVTRQEGKPGCGVGIVRSRMFLGEVGFLATLGVGVGFFCPTPNAQVDHFLHHTPKMGILGKMIQFLLQFVETKISCCAPQFPLILSQISIPLC